MLYAYFWTQRRLRFWRKIDIKSFLESFLNRLKMTLMVCREWFVHLFFKLFCFSLYFVNNIRFSTVKFKTKLLIILFRFIS